MPKYFFYLSNCEKLMIKFFTVWQGRESNDNNIKISLKLPHYSNNNNWLFSLLAHRLDDLIYFFPLCFLCWKSLALLAFLFFILTNNNIPQSHIPTIIIIISLFSISLSVEGHGIALTPWRLALTIIIIFI